MIFKPEHICKYGFNQKTWKETQHRCHYRCNAPLEICLNNPVHKLIGILLYDPLQSILNASLQPSFTTQVVRIIEFVFLTLGFFFSADGGCCGAAAGGSFAAVGEEGDEACRPLASGGSGFGTGILPPPTTDGRPHSSPNKDRN